MKIVLVNEEYPSETNFGGIATYQKIIAEEYARLGHEVTVICRGLNENKKYKEKKVNIIRVYQETTNNKKKDYINYRKKIRDILIQMQDENRIDIIETPDWGAETILFEKYRKVPLVVRLHTPLKVWLRYNKNNFGNVTKIMLKWEKKLIKRANLVTCCSNALLKEMKKDFKNLDNVIVTPNPANLKGFYLNERIKKENKIIYVGSVEERKGVIVLAKALNIVFTKYPNLKVDFIGKDTTRNNKNISTFEYIKEIIDNKFQHNIKFYGQLDNNKIMSHMNKALVGVYPSLFDNFPYVVLESMAVGLQVVGSSNSGMVEMLGEYGSIYETGNEESLAEKIIERYNIAQKENVNNDLIQRVKTNYKAETVCSKMLDLYMDTYNKYYEKQMIKNDVLLITKKYFKTTNYKIKELKKNQLANKIYLLNVNNQKYVLKKYNYDYRFDLSNKLYNICENNGIDIIKPINQDIIKIGGNIYNIFPYVKNKKNLKKLDKFYIKYLNINRKVEGKNILLEKVNNYSKLIENINYDNHILKEYIVNVLKIYNSIEIRKMDFDLQLNHGDISKNNIIYNKKFYLIDFDEANISYSTYDLAVIAIKNYVKNNKLDMKKVKKLVYNSNINVKDYNKEVINVIKLYLCKILLEKFYLHLCNKIDLFDKTQRKDYYLKYYKVLSNMEEANGNKQKQ